jgi:Na+/melibiose symporter-like transporter
VTEFEAGLARSRLIFYALPALVLGLPTIPVFIYLPKYYAEDLGLGLTATGLALFFIRLFDVVSDPVIGVLSDRLPTRFGRRRPWIALGAPIAGLALIQLFDPPTDVGTGFLLTWGLLLYAGWTLIAIPYTTWGAELSADYHERTRVTALREGVMLGGVVLAAVLPAVLLTTGRSEAEALIAIGWLAVALGLPSIVLLFLKVPERVAQRTGRANWRSYAQLFRNRPFVFLVGAWLINGLANGIPAVLFLLYMEHALAVDEQGRSILILTYFLSGIFAIPLWLWLSRRMGKHRVWCLAMLLACGAFAVVPFLGPGDVEIFFFVCVLTGMTLGADLSLPPAMQADVADYDRLRFGAERTATLFSLWNLATKLSLAGAVVIAFPLLSFFGFDLQGPREANPTWPLPLIYAGLPVVLKLIVTTMVWQFPLTAARQETIRRRLLKAEVRGR